LLPTKEIYFQMEGFPSGREALVTATRLRPALKLYPHQQECNLQTRAGQGRFSGDWNSFFMLYTEEEKLCLRDRTVSGSSNNPGHSFPCVLAGFVYFWSLSRFDGKRAKEIDNQNRFTKMTLPSPGL
jgi:hypothetical protein